MSCGQRQLPPAVAGAGDQRIGRLVLLGRHLEFLIEATGSAKVMAFALVCKFCPCLLPRRLPESLTLQAFHPKAFGPRGRIPRVRRHP